MVFRIGRHASNALRERERERERDAGYFCSTLDDITIETFAYTQCHKVNGTVDNAIKRRTPWPAGGIVARSGEIGYLIQP